MREIPLSRGLYAFVDDIDFEWANRWVWQVTIGETGPRVIRRAGRRMTCMHREIMERILGRALEPWEEVNHRNKDGLDNRRSELRLCSNSQSLANAKLGRTNPFGYKGAWRNLPGPNFMASLTVRGKMIRLYGFTTVEEAARAYDALAIQHFGKFARLNFRTPGYAWIGDKAPRRLSATKKPRAAVGERHSLAKLSADDVLLIRVQKNLSNAQLAKLFNVHPSTISLIRAHKWWKHLTEEDERRFLLRREGTHGI